MHLCQHPVLLALVLVLSNDPAEGSCSHWLPGVDLFVKVDGPRAQRRDAQVRSLGVCGCSQGSSCLLGLGEMPQVVGRRFEAASVLCL